MKHIYLVSLCLLLITVNHLYSRISENIYEIPNTLNFEDMSEIIPSTGVFCFYQDRQGFLWYGTQGDGLVRFDGLQCKIYSQIKTQIRDIVEQETDQGTIFWIAAYGEGIYKFNLQQETFRHYCHNPSDPASLSCDRTRQLYIHKDGSLWIGTMRGGINILRPDQMYRDNPEFIHIRHDSTDSNSLRNDEIKAIYKDKMDTLWFGTLFGISKLVSGYQADEDFKFENYLLNQQEDPWSTEANDIRVIMEDRDNYLWIGTSVRGVFRSVHPLNSGHKLCFKHYLPTQNQDNSIKGYAIYDMLEDRHGDLWITTYDRSLVNRYDRKSNTFVQYYMDEDNPQSYPVKNTLCIFEDHSGNLWFGGQARIAKLAPQKQQFRNFVRLPGVQQSLLYKPVGDVCVDRFGHIWLANHSVLTQFDPRKQSFTHYQHNPNNPNSLVSNAGIWTLTIDPFDSKILWLTTGSSLQQLNIEKKIFNLAIRGIAIYDQYPSRDGFLWLATFYGVRIYDSEKQFIDFVLAEESTTLSVFEDSHGILWAGTYSDGVLKYNRLKNQLVWYKHDPADDKSLGMNKISCFHEDRNGNIWIGTAGGGLNKLDVETDQIIRYTVNDGLAHNYVCSILDDDHGLLWISTNNGLSKFNPVDGSFRNYYQSDGTQGNVFFDRSCYKDPQTGYLYFGGSQGCTFFHPDSIKDNQYKPAVQITDFKLFNKNVLPGPDSPLPKNITFCKQITLRHDQSVFSLEFAALEFTNPQKNQYSYKMEGIDADWVHTDASRRFSTYTNLDPGTYTFRVKAANNDGVWNEEGTSLKIIILPPWWRTYWAYAGYFLLLALLAYILWRIQVNRLYMQYQIEMEQVEAQRIREVERMKTHFFANISHEFRTPLTLILSPINQLITGEYKGPIKDGYHIIRNNARRLLQLVNQLLSLSKLEAGQLKLQVAEQDLMPFLKRMYHSFLSLAERKQIEFDFIHEMDSLVMYFDEEKLETIMNNLLSNAFKFTPEGGEVEIELGTAANIHPPNSPLDRGEMNYSPLEKGDKGGCIILSISNSGPGIPAGDLEKIFRRFYQAEGHRHVEGTGIGLSLARDLVYMHHGRLTAQSEVNVRTTFTVYLPLDKNIYTEEEISSKPAAPPDRNEVISAVEIIEEDKTPLPISHPEHPSVLLVEDNAEMRRYLRENLQNRFNILEAANGKEALQVAVKELPELIISDVMMPEMDGFEFCEQVKKDTRSSHIPVILLTARATREDRLEGLKLGADDYLPKPFDLDELRIRADNLIAQRRNLRERFQREAFFGLDEIASSPIEQSFVQKIQSIIESNLDNPDYTTEGFARDLGMSRSQLFRKLKAWTNLTPNQFFRLCRLKKAAILLKTQSGNVTQVAYDVGIKNVSYFIRIFERHFGITPKAFAARHNPTPRN